LLKRGLRYVDELSEAFRNQLALAYTAKDLLGYGLRQRLREGYTRRDFRADLLSSLVVGVVALPLSMALAIAVDVPPQHGLYTAIVAGSVVALLGGCKFQVTGLPGAEHYLAVALQGLEDGQAGDPEFLATIKDLGTRVELGEGESKSVDVKLSTPK